MRLSFVLIGLALAMPLYFMTVERLGRNPDPAAHRRRDPSWLIFLGLLGLGGILLVTGH